MKVAAGVMLLLAAATGRAATAYVTDQLVLGVYADQNTQGQRLTTLHSGASVETLAVNGDSTEVRLPDGMTGWVKTSYLVTSEPAVVRIKQLQEELDRNHATTPALAEAAERSELERLKSELAARQSAEPAPDAAPLDSTARRIDATARAAAPAPRMWSWVTAVLAALACGFWLGHATLARRIKYKYGGIKVY